MSRLWYCKGSLTIYFIHYCFLFNTFEKNVCNKINSKKAQHEVKALFCIKWTVYCHESKWIKLTVPSYNIYNFYKIRYWCYLYHSIMNSGKHKFPKFKQEENISSPVQAFSNPNVHIDKISKLHFLSKMRPFIVFIYTCRIKEICDSFNL